MKFEAFAQCSCHFFDRSDKATFFVLSINASTSFVYDIDALSAFVVHQDTCKQSFRMMDEANSISNSSLYSQQDISQDVNIQQ
jgi:hypothetical protein